MKPVGTTTMGIYKFFLIEDKKINMMPVWLWLFKTKLNPIKDDDKDDKDDDYAC